LPKTSCHRKPSPTLSLAATAGREGGVSDVTTRGETVALISKGIRLLHLPPWKQEQHRRLVAVAPQQQAGTMSPRASNCRQPPAALLPLLAAMAGQREQQPPDDYNQPEKGPADFITEILRPRPAAARSALQSSAVGRPTRAAQDPA